MCPNVTNMARLFLIVRIDFEVPIQQVWRYARLMVAVRCRLVLAGSDHGYAALTQLTTDTTVPDIQQISFSSPVIRE